MAYQSIDLGTTAGDGTGDTIRDGGDKLNDNFEEIYTLLGTGTALSSGISADATVITLIAPTISGVEAFADNGDISNPVITRTGDTNTGIFFPSENNLSVTTGGALRTTVNSTGLVVVGNVTTTGTVEPAGDTAAEDNAAIGYTSTEGLILTGQGSTNDITIKNDADADVLEIPTGTTNVTVVGDITSAKTLNAAGDTDAGDNAAIGYTSAEGLILTGQGSTSDITLKNDADATVFTVPTGTTNVDIVGVATAATFEPDGDTAASDNAAIGYTSTEGLILTGQGSTNDITIKNDADADVIEIPTGTVNVTMAGTLDVVGAVTTAALTASGIMKTDDTTAATSTTDGSLQTDGGLSVVLDAVIGDDLFMLSDASVIAFGANSEITLAHVHNVGLTLTHATGSDDYPIVLQLKSEENAITANNVIASLEFAAGDSDGTDGATVAAGIHAIAEGTFSASANATKLVFTTGVSETAASSATAKATLSSIGDFQVAGDLVIKDGGLIGSASDLDALSISSGGVVNFTARPTFAASLTIQDGGSIGSASDLNAVTISSGGVVAVTATTASSSASTGALTVAGGAGVAADLSVGDDLRLLSDAAHLSFGQDSEVTLTHVHNDGLLLNTDMQLQFRDSAINIRSDADGDLDINADDEIELNSTLIDINGNVEISGTLTQTGVATFVARPVFSANITVQDGGQIGSASDADAIAIASDGVVTFTQAPVFPNGSIDIVDIDLDGATEMGAAIADADLFMIDDGAGGTMKSVLASRIASYIGAGISSAADNITGGDSAVTISTTVGNITLDAEQSDTNIILKGTDGGVDTTFLTISGAAAGLATFNAGITIGGNLIIPDAGNIGSASDTDAIAIASDGVVTFSQIPVMPANSIDSDEYIDGSIDLAHMSANSVDSDQYVDGSIDAAHLATNSVTTVKITDANVTSAKIASSAVSTIKIAADAITGTKIADDAIDSEHIVAGAIDAEHMAANSIDSGSYVDGSIDLAHMSANSIDSNQYVDGSIDTAHIADSQITLAKMATNSIDSNQYVDGSIDNAHIADDAINSEHYAAGSIDTAHIADSQITVAKMAANSVDSAQYVDDSIDTAHYAAGSVDATALGADCVTAAKIGDNVINSEHYAAGSIDNEHIADDAINSEHYAADSIDAEHYAAGSVDATAIAASAVGASELNVSGNGTTSQFLRSDGDGTMTWAEPTSVGIISVQDFTSSGTSTWSRPSGCTKVHVHVVGGGGGAYSGAGGSNGSPGGHGGSTEEVIDVSGVSSVTVTVGAGGASPEHTAASAGGTSSFGSYCSATGGGAGASTVGAGDASNGANGSGSNGQINRSGNIHGPLFGTGGASISDWPTQVTTTGVLGSAGKPGYVYIVNY